jgi:hypothetical protein
MIELESMAVVMPEVKGHPNRAAFRGVLTVVDAPSQRAPSGAGGRRVVLPKEVAEAALPSLLGMALDYAPSFDRHDARRKVGVITSAEIVGRNLEVGGYLYARDFPEIVEEIGKEGSSRREVKIPTLAQRSRKDGAASTLVSQSDGSRLRYSLADAVEKLRSLTAGLRAKRNSGVPLLRAESDGSGAAGLGMSYEVTDVVLADRRAKVWTLTRVTCYWGGDFAEEQGSLSQHRH